MGSEMCIRDRDNPTLKPYIIKEKSQNLPRPKEVPLLVDHAFLLKNNIQEYVKQVKWVICQVEFTRREGYWNEPYVDYFIHLPGANNSYWPIIISEFNEGGPIFPFVEIPYKNKEQIIEMHDEIQLGPFEYEYIKMYEGSFFYEKMDMKDFKHNIHFEPVQKIRRRSHKGWLYVPAVKGGDQMKTVHYGWFRLRVEFYYNHIEIYSIKRERMKLERAKTIFNYFEIMYHFHDLNS